MFSDILGAFSPKDRKALELCGMTPACLDGVPDAQKEVFLIYALAYTKIAGGSGECGELIRRVAGEELNIGRTYLDALAAGVSADALKARTFEDFFIDIPGPLAAFADRAHACLSGRKRILRSLDPASYEHELDRQYLGILKKTRGIDLVARKISEYGIEPFLRVNYTGSNIRVTPQMMPELHAILLEA